MNLKSSFCILVFTLSLCILACSSTDIQPQEISKQEFDKAFKQYQTYNLIADTNAVDSATRVRMTHEIKQLYGKWKEHINIFDKSMRLIPVDSASYNRLPMEYHAYSKAGLWAGEDWWEDAGEPPLNILVRKHNANQLKTICTVKDSTLCFPHAWEAKSIEALRRFIFWGADNTLYLMCYRYDKAEKQQRQSTPKDSPRPYVYMKIKVNENTHASASCPK